MKIEQFIHLINCLSNLIKIHLERFNTKVIETSLLRFYFYLILIYIEGFEFGLMSSIVLRVLQPAARCVG